jgi:hypothetical protein
MELGLKEVVINIPMDPTVLWFMLIIAILLFAGISFVFRYHWSYYGAKQNSKTFAKFLFFAVSFFLIFIMAMSAIAFESL